MKLPREIHELRALAVARVSEARRARDGFVESARCLAREARTPRAIVVDDDALSVRAISALLGKEFDVDAFPDPIDALDAIHRDGAYDLLVTDFNMPRMTGAELAAEVRRCRPLLPIIILTGEPDRAARESRGTGAAILPKSTAREELMATALDSLRR